MEVRPVAGDSFCKPIDGVHDPARLIFPRLLVDVPWPQVIQRRCPSALPLVTVNAMASSCFEKPSAPAPGPRSCEIQPHVHRLTAKRDLGAAKRFFRKMLEDQ